MAPVLARYSKGEKCMNTKIAALFVSALCLNAACGLEDDVFEDDHALESRIVVLASGEQLEITDDMICPETVDDLTGNEIVKPNPATDSLIVYRPVDGVFLVEESVTCTCQKETGGCSPFVSGTTTGCLMTSCTDCKKSPEAAQVAESPASGPEGFLRLDDADSNPAVFIGPMEEDTSYSCTAPTEGARRAYEGFLASVYGPDYQIECGEIAQELEGMTPPLGYSWAVVHVEGFASVALLPSAILPFQYEREPTSNVSCSCNVSGSCTRFIWACMHGCNASDCQSCTMSL
jgi:hypothetical protein